MFKEKIYKFTLIITQIFTWSYLTYSVLNYTPHMISIQILMALSLILVNVSQSKIYDSVYIGFDMPIFLGMLFIFNENVMTVPIIVYLISEAIERAIVKKSPTPKRYLFDIANKLFPYIASAFTYYLVSNYTNDIITIVISIVSIYALANLVILYMCLQLENLNLFEIINTRWLVLFFVLESYFTILVINLYQVFSLLGFYMAYAASVLIFNLLNRSIAIEKHQSTYNKTIEYFAEFFHYGIMILDKKKIVLSANTQFIELNNLRSKKIIGRPLDDLINTLPMKKEFAEGLDNLCDENCFFESNFIDEDRYFSITIISTDNDNIKYVLLLKDITKEYSDKINFLNEQRLASLEELAAGTANDIKNPLAVANGFLQLIKLKLNDEQLLNYTDEALQALEVTDSYIELFTLLGNGAKNHHKHKNINLSNILQGLLNHYSAIYENIQFNKEIDKDIIILGDKVLLSKAFTFIILNSIEAVQDVKRKEITIKLRQENSEIFLNVIDSGIGIEKESLFKIFDPYFTTKKNNAHGLGLFYSKKIVNHHNGHISITSNKGHGANVKIQLKK
ncbi:GHKL domain-containing protein [Alkalicella caledoniensis]|uniref:histidine kinase n=1 Tax=Alkalicella caledoniensis TaxID=2731377 RepID=A0A7G9W454_ALKCA|nr:ATP-binding protein [Alkalicella caledoniensis]QNO13466.1 GHKL domain-containing protein [Alkalicella caledoniensis]